MNKVKLYWDKVIVRIANLVLSLASTRYREGLQLVITLGAQELRRRAGEDHE